MKEETEEQLLQNAIKLKTQMEDLKDKIVFQRFLEEIKKQIEQRQSDVFGFPDGGLDSVVKNIYTTGEVAGLRMVLDFTDVLIDFAQAAIDIDESRKQAKEEDNG